MQVNNQPTFNPSAVVDSSIELKEGAVYRATIKERVSDNEAILHIRGRDQLARFEDGVPTSGNRVTVQVNEKNDQMVHVKNIETEAVKASGTTLASSEENVLKSLGLSGKESASLKQAVQILLDKDSPLSKENVQDLKAFMDKANGTAETKIETIKALANKRLEPTQTQLRAVHEALHGRPLNEVLTDIAKEIDPKFKLSEKNTNPEPVSQKVNPASAETAKSTQVREAVSNSVPTKPSAQATQLSELVRKSREMVEQEPNLKKAIGLIKEDIVKNPNMDRDLAQKVEKAVVEAEKLQTIGRDRLLQALKSAEEQLLRKEQQPSQSTNLITNQQASSQLSKDGNLASVVSELQNEVSKSPNLPKSVQLIKDLIVDNSRFPKEIRDIANKAVNEAAILAKQGRMTTGKEVLSSALAEIAEVVEKLDQKASVGAQPSEVVRDAKAEVRKEPNLLRAIDKVREQVVNHPGMDREVAKKVEQALKEAGQLQQIGKESVGRDRLQQALTRAEVELKQLETRQPVQMTSNSQPDRSTAEPRPSEVVKEVKAEVQREPNLQRAIEKVRDQVVNHPRMDREVAQKVEQALKEASQLRQIGQETAGRDRLQQALTKAEVELNQLETRPPVQSPSSTQPDRSTTEARPSEVVKEVKAEVQREPNLQRAIEKVRDQVVNNPKMDREVAQKVEQALKEVSQLRQIGQETVGRDRLQQALTKVEVELKQLETRQPVQSPSNSQPDRGTTEPRPSEVVKEVKAEVQREPNLQRAIEKIRDQVVNHPKIDREVAQKVEQALKEASQLQQIGKESVGRERLQQALTKAEVELKQLETRQPVQSSSTTQPDRGTTEPRPSEVVKEVKAEVQREPNLQRAIEKVNDQVVNHPKMDREVAQKLEQALKEANQLRQIGQETAGRDRLQQALTKAEIELKQLETRQPVQSPSNSQSDRGTSEPRPSEVLKEVKAEVQREPNLQRAIEKVRDQVVNQPRMDREVAEKVEQALKEANQLRQIGQETAGRDRLQQALTKAEVELKQLESRQPVQSHSNTELDRGTAEPRPSEVVKEVKAEVQREPNLQKAIEKVRDQVVNHPRMDQEVARKVEQALKEASQLQQIGRNVEGRERIQEALTKAEIDLKQIEGKQHAQPTQNNIATEKETEANLKQNEVQHSKQQAPVKDIVQQLKTQVQTESDSNKVLQKVQELVANNKIIDPEVLKNVERLAKQANQLDQAGRERLIKMLQQVEDSLKQGTAEDGQNINQKEQTAPKVDQLLNNTKSPEVTEQIKPQGIRPSETMDQVLKQLQKEPNLEKALEQVRKEITSNPNIDVKTIERTEKAINQANQLLDRGREIAARQQITSELTDIKQDLAKTEPKITQDQNLSQYDLNEQLQSMQIQSKDILVTKVSQKLAQATHDFRELKREISRSLDNVHRLVDTYKNNAYPQAKQMLETAISKLDNAILKSEMMLFTDMKTEKQLMQASSQLAEAKKLLAKGEHAQAGKIVQDVKNLIDKLIFKPSEQKIMHFVNKESLALENRSPAQQMLSQFGETTRGYTGQEASPRQMFEMVRSLGLNHDSDVAHSLVFNKADQSQNEQQQQNLKAVLMKLAQGEETNSKIAQQAEQALTNLTGQQLLSKSDASGTLQSMFFNLPLLLGGKPENLQVFVNSKNEGQQVDWQNCNLYFLLETKRLGDVGILLNSTDKNLSITIKNDKPGFKEKMQPLAVFTKEKLQEVGYNVSSLTFTRMTPIQTVSAPQTEPETQAKPTKPVFTEKGMDFKI